MGSTVTKALVLAAGRGSRLHPITRSIPKEMIRIHDKPVIQHLIEALRLAGINEVQVVLGVHKEPIINHLGSGDWLGIDVSYRIQEEPRGTADAVWRCKRFIRDDPFLVAYGDTYLTNPSTAKELLSLFNTETPDAMVALHWRKDVKDLGVASLGEKGEILEIIEKPSVDEVNHFLTHDGYLSIAGLLALQSSIISFIEKTQPGVNGEVWLTDSIRVALKEGLKGRGYICKSPVIDIGTFEAIIEAERVK